MSSIDPLGYSALFSPAQELNKKKEQKLTKTTSKQSVFASVLETAETESDIGALSDAEFIQSMEGKTFDEKLEFLIDSVTSGPFTDGLRTPINRVG